jgi:hypothetical protein
VLHHLADPDLGFKALLSVLKEDGAIGLMVYATTGRTGVYQMQELMRLVNGERGGCAAQDRQHARPAGQPAATNWFVRSEYLHHDHKAGDAGIYDLLLHSQDRSYSVGELFDWLGGKADGAQSGHGMHLEFTDVQRGRSPYLPHMVLGAKPPAMAAALRKLPLQKAV